MQLAKTILYKIFSLQEKFLRLRLSKTIGAKSSSKRKRHYGQGCTIELESLADTEKKNLEEKISLILKQCDYSPEKLLKYIESNGTKVYRISNASKILNAIGENEGFILPAKGTKAMYLSLSAEKKLSLKTEEMFIISEGEINKYYFLYHFYNWFAFKNGIIGLDRESQELLNKYLFGNGDTKELQLAEIYKLKDAIKQDKASIEFVIQLCRNYDGAKQVLSKIQTEGSAKL